jgi:archaemetzincin
MKLGLLKFEDINHEVIIYIRDNLSIILDGIFNRIDIIEEIQEVPKTAYNSNRNQYNASQFLQIVRSKAFDLNYEKILGITNVDLYTERLNFIFGQAEFGYGARACVISLKRLYPEFYKGYEGRLTSKVSQIFLIRSKKTSLHEIGHTLGLRHCNNNCIMRFSNIIEDTDHKPARFCDKCANKIKL